MADAPIDMHLPDSFHRLKRTAMLFSGGLLVMALAVREPNSALHLTLVDVDLPSVLTMWALWAGALYYLVGFAIEASVARRLNTTVMRSEGARSYEAQLVATGRDLRGLMELYRSRLDEGVRKIETTARSLAATSSFTANPPNWSAISSALPALYELRSIATQRALTTEEADRFVATIGRIEGQFHPFTKDREAFEQTLEQARSHLEDMWSTTTRIDANLRRVHHDFTQLDKAIAGERRVGFWFWECGGVGGLWFLATALAMPVFWQSLGQLAQPAGTLAAWLTLYLSIPLG